MYCSPKNCVNFYDNISEICLDYKAVKKDNKVKYINVSASFDIETSSFYKEDEKRCVMYAWGLGIGGRCVRGRTWDEFKECCNYIVKRYNLSLKNRIIIYIHNLSYEFQWFKNYFKWHKVFSLEVRKPVYAVTCDGIEFRCSYILSGYSLAKLGDNLLKYKVKKLKGDLDYSLIRHTKTPLTDKEWGYLLNDVLIVMAHIQEEIERLGDITKIPLTKTGYVRNYCREKTLKGKDRWFYNEVMKMSTLSLESYMMLKKGFMGGFTHANINYVNKIVENVHSFDFTSSYPAVMVSEKYPMGQGFTPKIKSEEDFIKYLKLYCCVIDITFIDIESLDNYENYISVSRCQEIENYISNNGRIIEADRLRTTITEQDFFIIKDLYTWECVKINNMICYHKEYLPKDFVLAILELYKDKTELKNVSGKEVEYMLSKNMLNSCYGMSVTDPCRAEIVFDNYDWGETPPNYVKLIEKYNKSSSRFLFYAWGVWVTAYARRNLFKGIIEFKHDYIYSDTDSLKCINIERHKDFIDGYNRQIEYKINQCLDRYNISHEMAKPKTIKGIEKQLGVWDYEGCYTRFKTLGAKRYIIEKNGDIEITIAGVSKSAGIRYLYHTYKDNDNIFNAFTDNLYFPANYDRDGIADNASGKMCHTYIDRTMTGTVIDYLGNKNEYTELGGVHLENTDYSLSIDDAFIKLINSVKESHIINV